MTNNFSRPIVNCGAAIPPILGAIILPDVLDTGVTLAEHLSFAFPYQVGKTLTSS